MCVDLLGALICYLLTNDYLGSDSSQIICRACVAECQPSDRPSIQAPCVGLRGMAGSMTGEEVISVLIVVVY